MKRIIGISFAILVFALLTGCDNGGDCNINNVSYYRTIFYNIDSDTGKEVKHQFPEEVNVSLVVNGNDSTVVNNMTDATDLALPMCYTQECDTVIIEFGNITDSMFVKHTNIPYFISMDCGTGMYHMITGVDHTNNLIDSVAVVYKQVNFDSHENIKLYIAQ